MERREAYEIAAELERRLPELRAVAKENPAYVANNWMIEVTFQFPESRPPQAVVHLLERILWG